MKKGSLANMVRLAIVDEINAQTVDSAYTQSLVRVGYAATNDQLLSLAKRLQFEPGALEVDE